MKTFFLTFGQAHRHVLKGVYFDKDCVVRIEARNADDAQEIAFMVFGMRWANIYDRIPGMAYFPRGVIEPVFKRGIPYNVRHLVEAND